MFLAYPFIEWLTTGAAAPRNAAWDTVRFHASAVEFSSQSAIRMRRSQRENSVTGRCDSVHPLGHPMIQSVKAGFKLRAFFERSSPFSNTTRHWWEEGIRVVFFRAVLAWMLSMARPLNWAVSWALQ